MNTNYRSINNIRNIRSSNNLKKNSKKGSKLFGYITILLIIVGAPVACIVYISILKKDKKIIEWNPNVTDQEKIKRTSYRGTIISIILMLSSLIQATLKGLGASSTMLLLLYGFFMASVIGFMGDQGYGTDDGFSLKEIGFANNQNKIESVGAQLKYIFGTLTTSSFWRFIITVFLDMFISAPIQSVIVAVFNPYIQILNNTIPNLPSIIGGLLKFITKNFDNVLQSFVAFITFLAYANETRFRWAYPGSDINPNLLISTSVIKISTAIAGVVYLIANISADFNIVEGATMKVGSSLVDRLDRKMWFVLIMIGLLTIGSMNEDSFLNVSNSKYEINPLVNISENKVWHLEDKLNIFYKQEMDKLLSPEEKKGICKEKTTYWDNCDVDPDTGNLRLEPNEDAKNNSLKFIINSKKETIKNLFIKTDSDNEPIIDSDTNTFITVENDSLEDKIKLETYIQNKGWDSNKPCFIPDHTYLCSCENYEVGEGVTTDLYSQSNYRKYKDVEYKKKFCHDNDNDIKEFKNKKKDLQKELDKAIKDYNNAVDKEYEQDNVNSLKIIKETAKENYDNYIYEQKLNERNGTLVKKIDMGLFRISDSNIKNKYKIMDEWYKGFGIFCLYLLVGIIVPFIPIKFIYGDELKEKGRIWKLIVVSAVMSGLALLLFIIAKKAPDNDDLKKKEKEILNQSY